MRSNHAEASIHQREAPNRRASYLTRRGRGGMASAASMEAEGNIGE